MVKNLNEKLKVGILSFYYPHLGGSGIVTTRIAEYLAKNGHEVHFIGYDSDINPKNMKDLGINLHKVSRIDYPALKNEPYSWTLGSKICEVHKKHNLDLIHANYAIPHSLAAYVAREKLKMDGEYLPYVVTGHGSDIHTNGNKNEINPILQLTLNQADAITYVSNDLKKIAENQLGILQDGKVIPNFVDTEVFYNKTTDLRKKLNIPENAFVIGHVSNFAPVKKTEQFSELATYMKGEQTLDNVYFLMVGDGKEKAALEEDINRLGIKKHFIFRGKQEIDEVIDSYNASDVVLLTSKHEGNPLTLLEAMACKKTVIGSNVGGISETIKGSGGYLYELGDIASLGKIISNLKTNREECSKAGLKGYEKAINTYSVDTIMDQYFDIYNKIRVRRK